MVYTLPLLLTTLFFPHTHTHTHPTHTQEEEQRRKDKEARVGAFRQLLAVSNIKFDTSWRRAQAKLEEEEAFRVSQGVAGGA
jgi:hypothetical protein